MKQYFLISDVHGMYDDFLATLKEWRSKEETLVLMGDLIDRGPKSKEVLHYAYQLSLQHDVILVRGNHEEAFLSFLEEPGLMRNLYEGVGGRETFHSFFGKEADRKTAEHLGERFMKEQEELIHWLQSAKPYVEDEQAGWSNIFVHAGVDLSLDNWKDTPESDFAWIRNDFIYAKNQLPNTRFFFGHTPTRTLNEDGSDEVFIMKDNKVGIDGGCCFGGTLHGVRVCGEHYEIVKSGKA